MNRILFFFIAVISITELSAQKEAISLGNGYSMDVYYSLENGIVKSETRANWDIAFTSSKMSASILSNGGSGVELYSYPNGDSSAWATVDTAGISQWTTMQNSESTWEEGAFNSHATGHPDYGWGVYNMITHNLTGDSIFIIKTRNGNYKKLRILSKESAANNNSFYFSDLDGSNPLHVTINADTYQTKNFVYYDLEGAQIVDREPASSDWDFVFTKYMAKQGTGGFYPVVGVLLNYNVMCAKAEMVDTSYSDWTQHSMSDSIGMIGWNWKSFNMTSFSYEVADSTVFFVKNQTGDVYKLVFTGFDGSSTGNVYLNKQFLSANGISQAGAQSKLNVFPNPVQQMLHVSNPDAELQHIQLFDVNGKLLEEFQSKEATIQLDMNQMPSGLYFIQIRSKQGLFTQKLIKQ